MRILRSRTFAVAGPTVFVIASVAACSRPSATAIRYVCPMHPQQTSNRPADCAVCGMKLVPMEPPGTKAPRSVAGLSPVSIPEETRKQMGLGFSTVERKPVRREARIPARIVADQSRIVRMNAPVEGWIDHVHVNGTGEKVKKGMVLFDLYSVDGLYAFKQGLALAGRESSPDLVRQRLRRWGVDEAQIDRLLELKGRNQEVLQLSAPIEGFIAEKNVFPGQKVASGDLLMVLADLSQVWAEVDLFESDIAWVKPGMTATITFPYWPEKEFRGKVTVLNPFLDPKTRTLRARIEIPNISLDLKPEMFGTAHLSVSIGERLVVPEGAVMRTGERSYVFRALEGDRIEPVEVKLGVHAEGVFEILSGLGGGDRVVASATFLVDSESALKAALESVAGR